MTTNFVMTAGAPFARSFRLKDAKLTWSEVNQLEVRAQLRNGKDTSSELIENLHTYMSWSFVEDDLVILLELNGAETRGMHTKLQSFGGKGSFNVIVSDVGTEDERALVFPLVQLKSVDTTTSAGGVV